MNTTTTTTAFDHARNNAQEHAAGIARLMAALEVDYDELDELKSNAQDLRDELADTHTELDELIQVINADAEDEEKELQLDEYCQLNERAAELTNNLRATADELADLQINAGDFTDRDAVETELYEYPLEVTVRSGWESIGEPLEATEYAILLSTGGPAARIRGELDEDGTPTRAWMEAQDWGTPWTDIHTDYDDALLEFAQFIIPN